MWSPVSRLLPFAALPAAYSMISPTLVEGGVQSKCNVVAAPFAVRIAPAKVCSMYCRFVDVQGTSARLLVAQSVKVALSIGARTPALVFESLANRAVN